MENRGICRRLRMLNNAIRRYTDRNSQLKSEVDNLTCSNGWIIAFLHEAECEGRQVLQRDLEDEFGITRSTASRVLILLEKKGVIIREGVSHDARMKRLLLTDRARELGSRMRAHGEMTEQRLTEGFSPQELITLSGFLDRLMNNVDMRDDKPAPIQKKE